MFNVGGGELLVILIVALVVLGPKKLPEVARQVGGMARELRRMSASFQAEMKSALDEPVEEAARDRGRKVVGTEEQPAPQSSDPEEDPALASTAAAAGMYDNARATEPDQADEAEDEPLSDAEAAGLYDIGETEAKGRGSDSPGTGST